MTSKISTEHEPFYFSSVQFWLHEFYAEEVNKAELPPFDDIGYYKAMLKIICLYDRSDLHAEFSGVTKNGIPV